MRQARPRTSGTIHEAKRSGQLPRQQLGVLDRDPHLTVPERRVLLWAELEADQYPQKFNGDQDTAFLGAHLEKRGKRANPLVHKSQDAAG